jgi:hypothetical protein
MRGILLLQCIFFGTPSSVVEDEEMVPLPNCNQTGSCIRTWNE